MPHSLSRPRPATGRVGGGRYWLDDNHILGGAAGVYQKRPFLETG
jgi:hypothetical protein